MRIKKVDTFESKEWSNAMSWTLTLITFTYHGFLIYYNTTPFLYFWFLFSILHFFIHAYKARRAVTESNEYSVDEIWHILNHLFCYYYLYTAEIEIFNLQMYSIFLCLYLTLIFAGLYGYAFNKLLYYLGSFMAAFFIFSLQPSYDIYNLSFFMSSYYFVVVSTTYNNPIGRKFMLLNIAGCAFISESFILHLVHNGIV